MNTNSENGAISIMNRVTDMVNTIKTPLLIEQFLREIEQKNSESFEKQHEEITESDNRVRHDENAPTIYVDPGHGGDNNGTSDKTTSGGVFTDGSGLTEETNNFKIALKVKEKLEAAGYNVKMSRDQAGIHNAIGNTARGKEAAGCAAAVCIHSNGGSGNAYGCFNVYDPRYSNYSHVMGDEFLACMQRNGRNVAYSGYYSKQPAFFSGVKSMNGDTGKILYVEVGHHDNSTDIPYISSDAGHSQIAECIVSAIKKGVPI